MPCRLAILNVCCVALVFPTSVLAQNKMTMSGLQNQSQQCFQALNKGSYREALELSKQVLHEEPKNLTALRYQIYALNKLGQFEDSAQALKVLWNVTRPSAFDWCSLGDVYTSLNQFSQAGSCYRQAIKLEPNSVYYRYCLIVLLQKFGELDLALSESKQALAALTSQGDRDYIDSLYKKLAVEKSVRQANGIFQQSVPKPVDFRQIY